MIRFINVAKNYVNTQTVLSNISFELRKGEMAFLTGHSGAGKSTLLKLIMMMESMTSGQIFVDQYNLNELSKKQIPYLRRNIGMIFQDPHLLANRTVFENVAIPLIIARLRPLEIKRKVRAALAKLGLSSKEKCLPIELSGGEQQRVGIARAVVNKPSLLLADEPTGNLDPELSSEIIRLFADFNAVGVTVLVATHDLSLIAPLNYRIITLKTGQLIRDCKHEV